MQRERQQGQHGGKYGDQHWPESQDTSIDQRQLKIIAGNVAFFNKVEQHDGVTDVLAEDQQQLDQQQTQQLNTIAHKVSLIAGVSLTRDVTAVENHFPALQVHLDPARFSAKPRAIAEQLGGHETFHRGDGRRKHD